MSDGITLLKDLLAVLENNPELLAEVTKSLPVNTEPVPTVDEWIPKVKATTSKGTLRGYRPYWTLLSEHYGDVPINKIEQHELEA